MNHYFRPQKSGAAGVFANFVANAPPAPSYPDVAREPPKFRPLANGRQLFLSEEGTIFGASSETNSLYTVEITHPLIPLADRQALDVFYAENLSMDIPFIFNGESWLLRYATRYTIESVAGGLYCNMTATFNGRRA